MYSESVSMMFQHQNYVWPQSHNDCVAETTMVCFAAEWVCNEIAWVGICLTLQVFLSVGDTFK